MFPGWTYTRWSLVLFLPALCLFGIGCSKQPSASTINKARQAVEISLAQWKQGGKSQGLSLENQTIEFTDEDWHNGHRLLEYDLRDTLTDAQQPLRVVVKLVVQTRGQKITKEVAYEIQDQEKIIIGRDGYY